MPGAEQPQLSTATQRRRRVLLAAAATALSAAWPAFAQKRRYRMSYLSSGSSAYMQRLPQALFRALRPLGYVEGQNLTVERRFADGRFERLPTLAGELAALKPDVFFAAASQAALAASRATNSIPIVFVAVSDPVGLGIVKSLARPGTNATGFSLQNIEVHAKRLQLLLEALPGVRRLAVLHNPLNVVGERMLQVLAETAASLKVAPTVFEVRTELELDTVFSSIEAARPDALYVLENPFSLLHMKRIVDFANAVKLPAVYGLEDFALAGGLMSYAFDVEEHYRLAADYVAKVLKGTRPMDLPVQQPTRFELIVNLKTAKALGVTFPAGFVARADRVIQ